ncbi:hypothetical protein Q7P37_002561 [Cladosporium fusiforme]
MAQGTYASTYQTYKAGTKQLTTWLVLTAQKCGIKVEPSKGYDIPLSKFVDLAKSITASKHPKIEVPKDLLRALDTVITLRKETGKMLGDVTGGTAFENSHASHQYFITILEQVLGLLSRSSGPASQPLDNGGQESASAGMSNRFAALPMEQSPVPDADIPTPQPKNAKKCRPQDNEMQADKDDNMFAVLDFLKDFSQIRSIVTGVWKDYRDGDLDPMSAAVTTDTAYGIIKRNADDLMSVLPAGLGFASLPFVAAGGDINSCPELPQALLNKFPLHVWCFLREYMDLLLAGGTPSYNGQGFYCPEQRRTEMPAQLHFKEDLTLLMRYLSEITKSSQADLELPVQDELTAGLRIMIDGQNFDACPLHVYFNTSLFLDIQHILRGHAIHPFEELRETAKNCIQIIDDYFFSSEIRSWPSEDDESLRQIKRLAQDWVIEDRIGSIKTRKPLGVGNEPPPFYFMQSNPVFCGLLTFRLNLLRRDAGQHLINKWNTVIKLVHLYNACRQSGGLDHEWADFESLYQLHTQQRLFVGAPPKDPSAHWRHFMLAGGISAVHFAPNRRPVSNETVAMSKKGPRGFKTTSPVREAFHPRYVKDSNALLNKSSFDAEKMANEVATQSHLNPIHLLLTAREGVAAEELHLLFDYFGLHRRRLSILGDIREAVKGDIPSYPGQGEIEYDTTLQFVVGGIFALMFEGSDGIGTPGLPNHRSKILEKASKVLSGVLASGHKGPGSQGLVKAMSLTRAYRYICANNIKGCFILNGGGIGSFQLICIESQT